MCQECETNGLNRRNLFKLAGLAGVGFTAAALTGGATTAAARTPTKPVSSPAEALAKLKEGNRRFVEDADACAAGLASLRGELTGGQHPWATILTCSDSRVSPELVFGGATLGELFVVRNAGNVLDTGALGTIEYGAEHLKSPLVVVMGHSKCGAVSAACEEVEKGSEPGGSIGKMIQPILPAAIAARSAGASDLIADTVRRNAISGAVRIANESAIMRELVEKGEVQVVAAVYDIATGKVEFIDSLN
ncbi:carbonic anhydrase [Rhizobium sp. AAP43]|uniref:carbonic anhydrase n=1 Tax=Rhizobium sp. AAP43 TaxID=1523420 RepID=UPI0006B8C810|nr:carbonic anhydrase [Rhizobium sp. AAP43]KPF46810.1 carbonic anhydrase [Rhizobium sp. AAP43]